MNQGFELLGEKLDSREIAKQMGVKHEKIMQTIRKYRNQSGKHGIIPFQTGIVNKCVTEEDTSRSSEV